MLSRRIRRIECNACGFRGPIHDPEAEAQYPSESSFAARDTDAEGFLHFACPACKSDLTVDPSTVPPGGRVIGHPPDSDASSRVVISNPVLRWVFVSCVLFTAVNSGTEIVKGTASLGHYIGAGAVALVVVTYFLSLIRRGADS